MKRYQTQIHRCFRCGYCKFPTDYSALNCPSYNRFRFDTYSTGGRLWLTYAWLKGDIPWSEHLAEILYACTTCKNCVEQCPMKFAPEIVDWIIEARSDMVEQGKIPLRVKRFLESVYNYGNPLKKTNKERLPWIKSLKKYEKGTEYLLYLGCLASYDEGTKDMVTSLVKMLDKAGISYGVMGDDEQCCGNEVYAMGEMDLFKELAGKNIDKFRQLGVKSVITICPHGYNIMKNQYQGMGYKFEVLHYSQALAKIADDMKPKKTGNGVKITYHDPCYLGRHNKLYETPRKALKGLELVEMPRNRKDAFCCGGGSGNFITDYLAGGNDSPARVRVREAAATGAGVLAVACPGCLLMLKEAVKTEDLDEKLQVMDIASVMGR
ncbi:MAG: (Fe-S)-binding protein [Dehalococcoidia bacterium]|nr:(Fe-S)-binding protein [Dehalococcoidia bacterium]MDD5494659.1 (Fe-S)-binding protein [Dehalococcoidia bacterium]